MKVLKHENVQGDCTRETKFWVDMTNMELMNL